MAVNNVSNSNPAVVSNPTTKGASEAAKSEKTVAAKQAAATYAKAAEKRPATISEAANVHISQQAREMSQAKKAIADTPDVREDKVAKFKSLIAKGEYKPDAGKIADGILSEAIRDELAKNPDSTLE